MTEVAFHFNAADKIAYACRLLRKACRANARVVVTGEPALLAELDRVLWTFEPLEFVPHLRAARAGDVGERLKATPLWLLDSAADAAASSVEHQILVNLGPGLAPGFESFQRLIEIVSSDADDRQAARLRWKHYADRGYSIERHEVPVRS